MDKMRIEPDSVIWRALLRGCRKHDETKLAKLAVVKLRELQSRNLLRDIQRKLEMNNHISLKKLLISSPHA